MLKKSMTLKKTRPRTQADLDAYMAARPRPLRNTFEGMYPLHADLELSDEQVQIVLDYLQEVNFHLPGAAAHEFLVVRWADCMALLANHPYY